MREMRARDRRWKSWRWLLGALVLALGAAPAGAVTVALDLDVVPPTPAAPQPGNSIFIEISVSGLTAGSAPSLMSAEVEITFDDGALDWVAPTGTATPFDAYFGGVSLHNGSGDPCFLANLDATCDVILDWSSSAGVV